MKQAQWEWHQKDPADDAAYEKLLRELGWCLSCQGYGQDWGSEEGADCEVCQGTGKIKAE